MNKGSIVERLCSDLDRKEPRYKSPTLLYFTVGYPSDSLASCLSHLSLHRHLHSRLTRAKVGLICQKAIQRSAQHNVVCKRNLVDIFYYSRQQLCSRKFGAGGTLGGLGRSPSRPGSRGRAPGRGVRGFVPPEAESLFVLGYPKGGASFHGHLKTS